MTWPELLDAMERRVQAAGRTVTDGLPAPDDMLLAPPGTLPPELAPRAAAALAATRAMEQTVSRRLAEVGAEVRALNERVRPAMWEERRPPAYVDTRA